MIALGYIPAAPVQVDCVGRDLECPDCHQKVAHLYGLMYEDRTMRCGLCHDDAFYADSAPGIREKAEQHRDDVLGWIFTGQTPAG